MVDDDNPRRRYSLSGGTSKPAAPAPSPKAPAAPAKPVNTSTFLTRIANSAIRESTASSGGQSGAGNPRWMQIDHSSPAANLNSRLRWVENAFKEQPQAPVQTRTQVQHAPVQQAPAQQQNPASPRRFPRRLKLRQQ